MVNPEVELHLNSKNYDNVEPASGKEDMIILQQFEGEEETVYLTLNDTQVTVSLKTLKNAVEMLDKGLEQRKLEEVEIKTPERECSSKPMEKLVRVLTEEQMRLQKYLPD